MHDMLVTLFSWKSLLFIISTAISGEYEFDAKGCYTNIRAQNLNADFIFGGFVPAHLLNKNAYTLNYPPITWTSAIIYAIEEINRDNTLLPNVTLGYDVRDTCNEKQLATKFSLEFMLDLTYLRPKVGNIRREHEFCIRRNKSQSILAGIIGGASSSISTVVSSCLGTDFIPQISYSSTSAGLSVKSLHRSFLRTVPSDVYQASAITDLLIHFNWTYVSAFAADDEYGRLGLDELRKRTNEKGICLAFDKLFAPRITEADKAEIIKCLRELNGSSHVVILWCQLYEAVEIILEVQAHNITNITWVGTETWGSRENLAIHNFQQNIIGLELDQPKVQHFEKSFETNDINCKNPWYREFLKTFNLCCPGYSSSFCSSLTDSAFLNRIIPKVKYPQVIASVYALAHGLHKTLNCAIGGCSLRNKSVNYKMLYQNIIKSDFIVPNTSNYRVSFDGNGGIANKFYKFIITNSTKQKEVGYWVGNGTVAVNIDWGNGGRPLSRCSHDCLPGYYRIKSSSCCWKCALCARGTISTNINQDKCKPCTSDEMTDLNHTKCLPLKELRLTMTSSQGIAIIVLSLFGVLCAAFILAVFVKYWDTPIIKSSSREMSCIQLVSLLLLFCIPILHMTKLTALTCMLQTLVFGFLLTTVIAMVVVKTYRLLRVFSERFTKVSRFLHNKYQILLAYVLVLVQFAAIGLWYIHFPAEIELKIDRRQRTYYTVCGNKGTVIYWTSLLYVFLLCLVSGYMAFRARKLPENFNEAQFITFAMFTTSVVWAMYLPLYLSLDPVQERTAYLCVNFISTLCILLILYGYKVRIVLLFPKLNSPEHFRKMATAVTVMNFAKDVKQSDGETRTRYQSVIMFEMAKTGLPLSLPRRLSLDQTDRTEAEPLMDKKALKRRASFSSLTMIDKEHLRREPINIQKLKEIGSEIKRSTSSPLLCEKVEENAGFSLRRPASYVAGRITSSHSINRLLCLNEQDKAESQRLLCDGLEV